MISIFVPPRSIPKRKSDPNRDTFDVAVSGGQCAQDTGTGLEEQQEQIALGVQANLAPNAVFFDEFRGKRRKALLYRRFGTDVALAELRVQTQNRNEKLAADAQAQQQLAGDLAGTGIGLPTKAAANDDDIEGLPIEIVGQAIQSRSLEADLIAEAAGQYAALSFLLAVGMVGYRNCRSEASELDSQLAMAGGYDQDGNPMLQSLPLDALLQCIALQFIGARIKGIGVNIGIHGFVSRRMIVYEAPLSDNRTAPPRNPNPSAPMLVRFDSSETAEVLMYAETAKMLLEVLGKATTARGTFTQAEMLPAAAALREAAKQAARQGGESPEDDEDDAAGDKKKRPPVSFSQRAWPLIDMLERTSQMGEKAWVVWEASADF